MTLPLQDAKNPLYNLDLPTQCQKLVTLGTGLKPWAILSLNPIDYTEEQVNKAYRQLSLRFHPDRIPEIKIAGEAFNVVNQAKEYMHYGLQSVAEKSRSHELISKNFFYKQYGDSAFNDKGHPHPHKDDSKTTPYAGMSFLELVAVAENYPMPQEVVALLKQFVLADKSLLSLDVNKKHPKRKLLNVIAEYGEEDFIIWLLEQGADPLIFSQGSQNPAHDLPHYAIAGNTPGVLRYLFQHYGSTFFYQQVEDKTTATPLWRHLEFAIEMNQLEITNFLFNEVGFLPHAKGRKFDAAWYSGTDDFNDNSAITALLMKHNLLKKLDSALYYAIGQGAMPAIKQILTQKPKLDTEKLFKAYFNCPKKKKPEFIDLMLNLFAAQKEVPALALKEILNQLIHMLRLAPQEGDPKQQAMVLALLPALFTRLHGYNLPSEAELRAQPIYQLSHEGQQELLYRVLYEVALANSPKTLKTLLAAGSFLLGSQPLLVSFLHEISKKVVKYEATISLLVDAGGESLAYQTPDYYQDYSPHRSYEKYTALHFLCELGTNKQIRHLIEKMVAEHCSLDAICHKKVRKSRTAPFTVYHYTALHFALEQGQQEVAVKLIEAGADFTIKAVVERPSTYFYNYFPRMNKSETTPLQIAIEQKQIAVLRALQLKMLDSYIVQRSKEEIYLSHITLFGYTFFRFGFFHKTTKLDAAEDYRKALLRGEVDYQELDKLHRGALSQGRLGAITQLADTIKENLDAHQKPTVKI